MIALIACSARKQHKRCKAKDIYQGELFKKSWELANKMGVNQIYILSAKHHLLDPETVISPYNMYLCDMPMSYRKKWADTVIHQMKKANIDFNQKVLFFAGRSYTENLHGLFRAEQNMYQGGGIGYILNYLSNKLKENRSVMKSLYKYIMESLGGSKMSNLTRYLQDRRNVKEFASKYNLSDKLVEHAFAWIEGCFEYVENFEGVIDFCYEDAPDNFPEYATSELSVGTGEINKVDWKSFFKELGENLERV